MLKIGDEVLITNPRGVSYGTDERIGKVNKITKTGLIGVDVSRGILFDLKRNGYARGDSYARISKLTDEDRIRVKEANLRRYVKRKFKEINIETIDINIVREIYQILKNLKKEQTNGNQ